MGLPDAALWSVKAKQELHADPCLSLSALEECAASQGTGCPQGVCGRAGIALKVCVDTRVRPGLRCPPPGGMTAVTWGPLILSSQTPEVTVETADHRRVQTVGRAREGTELSAAVLGCVHGSHTGLCQTWVRPCPPSQHLLWLHVFSGPGPILVGGHEVVPHRAAGCLAPCPLVPPPRSPHYSCNTPGHASAPGPLHMQHPIRTPPPSP